MVQVLPHAAGVEGVGGRDNGPSAASCSALDRPHNCVGTLGRSRTTLWERNLRAKKSVLPRAKGTAAASHDHCERPHAPRAPRSRAPNRQAAPSLPNSPARRQLRGTHWWRALLRAGRAEECNGLGAARGNGAAEVDARFATRFAASEFRACCGTPGPWETPRGGETEQSRQRIAILLDSFPLLQTKSATHEGQKE